MKGARVLAAVRSQPWALQPDVFAVMSSVLERWARGDIASPAVLEQVRADASERRARRAGNATLGGGTVAVVPVYGILSQRGSMMDDLSGGGSTSTQAISQALRDALADDSVGSIILDCDSPGGSVFGIQELADEIYQARARKPVIGFANSLCASAAFWIAAQCSELYCTVGGEVGSIGVLLQHQDWSGANEQAGLRITYLTAPAGGFKSEGNPNEPLSDEARTYEQGRLNEYYAAFVQALARGRGVSAATVRGPSWGLGRVLGAREAFAAKMIDGIATFDEVIARARAVRRPQQPAAQIPAPGRAAAGGGSSRIARMRNELTLLASGK